MQDLPPLQMFDAIRQRHGHYCPMSTLGGRMGFAARQRLDAGPVRAVYLARTCAVDGIAVALDCTPDEGTLCVRDEGRHALQVRPSASGLLLDVALRPEALAMAMQFRRMDEALERDRAALDAAELERRLRDKKNFLHALLHRLRTLPEDALLDIRAMSLDGDLKDFHA